MIDFKTFCAELLHLFVNQDYFDEPALKRYHAEFKEYCVIPNFDTVERFAKFYFQDWKPETHSAWLKSEKEKRNDRKPIKEKKLYKIKPYNQKTQNIKAQEAKVMREFWDENADDNGFCRCMETGELLRAYDPYYVHHVYTKGANCLSRLDKENLVIIGYTAHNQAHNLESKMKLYPHFLEIREKMKIKYGDKVKLAT